MAQVRRATVADSAGIARVQVDNYRTAYAGLLPTDYLARFSHKDQEQDWRDWPAVHPNDVLCVAVDDGGEVVGYALGRPGPGGIAPYDGELLALHVRQLNQRLGVGRQLVAAVAGELQRLGCSSLMLWTLEGNPSRAFHQRLGGRLVGEQMVTLDEGITAVEVAYGWPRIESLCGLPAKPEEETKSAP